MRKANKNKVVLFITVLAIVLLVGGCEKPSVKIKTLLDQKSKVGRKQVEIEIEDYGIIKLELDGNKAPITTSNFIELAEEGFYDNTSFHRVVPGFVIQGGSPKGEIRGGSVSNIKGEFSANGVENDLSHIRGAISMARADHFDSASSQFFIVHQDCLNLDEKYAAFGYVIDGMEIVDEICKNIQGEPQYGIVEVENQAIIKTIRVIK